MRGPINLGVLRGKQDEPGAHEKVPTDLLAVIWGLPLQLTQFEVCH